MSLLTIKNISIKGGDKDLFHIKSLDIDYMDKIGLVGYNGSGKSTFLKYVSDLNEKSGYWIFQHQEMLDSNNNTSYKEKNIWKVDDLEGGFDSYSGGEKMRTYLSNVFSANADIYVFDEPTANLDIEGINLFVDKIQNLDTYIIVSHDRYILDELTNRTLVIKDEELIDFPGNYSAYLEWSKLDEKRRVSEYENYINEKNRLEKALENKKRQSEKLTKKPKGKTASELKQMRYGAIGKSIDGKSKSLSSQAKHIKKRIDKLDKKEKPKCIPKMKIEYNLANPPQNKILIRADSLNFCYGKKEIFRNASFDIQRGEKIALTGKNGIGKTTLFNLIRDKYKDIYIVPALKIGYLRQNLDNLDFEKSIYENLKSDSIQSETINRIILRRIGFDAQRINNKAKTLSSGEKIKLSLAMLCVSDINFLILDEPTNYLDIESVKVIEELLIEYEGSILFTSHDIKFVENVATTKWVIDNLSIEKYM